MDGRADGDLMETEKDHQEVAWVDPDGRLLQNHASGEEARGLLPLGTDNTMQLQPRHPSSDPWAMTNSSSRCTREPPWGFLPLRRPPFFFHSGKLVHPVSTAKEMLPLWISRLLRPLGYLVLKGCK